MKTIKPGPCETRKSRIHLRLCGARRDGRGRREGGGGDTSAETTAHRSEALAVRLTILLSLKGASTAETTRESKGAFQTGLVCRHGPCHGVAADGSSHSFDSGYAAARSAGGDSRGPHQPWARLSSDMSRWKTLNSVNHGKERGRRRKATEVLGVFGTPVKNLLHIIDLQRPLPSCLR